MSEQPHDDPLYHLHCGVFSIRKSVRLVHDFKTHCEPFSRCGKISCRLWREVDKVLSGLSTALRKDLGKEAKKHW